MVAASEWCDGIWSAALPEPRMSARDRRGAGSALCARDIGARLNSPTLVEDIGADPGARLPYEVFVQSDSAIVEPRGVAASAALVTWNCSDTPP
jgi:hypothetical protein